MLAGKHPSCPSESRGNLVCYEKDPMPVAGLSHGLKISRRRDYNPCRSLDKGLYYNTGRDSGKFLDEPFHLLCTGKPAGGMGELEPAPVTIRGWGLDGVKKKRTEHGVEEIDAAEAH
jgi:hypothetical protein